MVPKEAKYGNRTECHYWGYSFRWTDLHPTADELRPMIHTCDTLADECVEKLNKIAEATKEDGKPLNKDLYGLLRDHADEDPKLTKLWTEINTVPDWVDWEQIRRGQDVFFRYATPIFNADHLPDTKSEFCRGAIRVVETLARTGGFSAKVVRRRLLETVQHTLQVNRSLEGMQQGGEGQVSSVRVRLLHSAVRLKILSLVDQDPHYYDVKSYGIPVNDLDSMGTINSFSGLVVFLGLPRQGIYLSEQEVEDYIAVWRLVAYYMGTPTDYFEGTLKSRALMESFLVTEFEPTEIGKVLAQNIILGLENTAPTYASKGFMEAMSRLLNGDQLADALEIPPTSLYNQVLLWGYCYWVRNIAYFVPKIGFLDRAAIAFQRKQIYKLTVEDKTGLGGETRFDFKYIPSLTRTTTLGERRPKGEKKAGIEALAMFGLLLFAITIAIPLSTSLLFLAKVLPQSQLDMTARSLKMRLASA